MSSILFTNKSFPNSIWSAKYTRSEFRFGKLSEAKERAKTAGTRI